ncbi:MAG: 30S ribosomal protein S6 [Patescibacteria group bacterium]
MAEDAAMDINETDGDAAILRIYEVGYHVIPTVKEEDVEKVVGEIRSVVEKAGGSFIAEGAPALTRLAYPMPTLEGEKHVEYDRGYFGWIKFEAAISAADMLNEALKKNSSILRHIVFQTVREDTRAKMKAPQLREVKRTDVIKAAPRRVEETSVPVSEEDLEKAIQDITTE